jgi:hypothetical protein
MVASGTTCKKSRYAYGPSLKPLSKLPHHLTEEENNAEVAAQVKAHFGPKPPPPPKEKVPEDVIQHFIDNAQSAVKHRDSDYEHSIKKSYHAQK